MINPAFGLGNNLSFFGLGLWAIIHGVVKLANTFTDYRRVDCDLFVEKSISLKDTLCGFTCTLYPLDERSVGGSKSPGAVLSPGE